MSPTFRSLRIPNYRRYAAGMAVSNTGSWMQRVAQDWLVLQLSGGSALALGITTALQFAPLALFGMVGGLLADRYSKRHLLLVTNAVMGLTALILGVLALTGTAQVWHVYALAFALGVGAALDTPARQSFVVEMVGPAEVSNAVGLNSASFNAARIVGPATAGLLIEALGGTGWVFILNALTYAAPILALRGMDTGALQTPPRTPRARGQLREGVRYVRSRPDLLAVLAIVFFAGTFGLNFQITNALMATKEFGLGAGEFGLLGTVFAVGSLAGALLAARRRVVRVRLVVGAAMVFGLLEIVLGLMPNFTWYALMLVPTGVAALTVLTAANACVQATVAPELRGRVMALYIVVLFGGTPFGAPTVGLIAEAFGPRWSVVIGGAVTALAAAIAGLLLARITNISVRPRMFPRPRLEFARSLLDIPK
ncbi:MAG: MFS transporter [Sporichthyaceae bacterium]